MPKGSTVNEILELTDGSAAVRIAPAMGCAIVAFTVGAQPVLRPTPAEALSAGNVRLAGCYPLVPYSNRIRDAQLHFAGKCYVLERNFGTHAHAIHGRGWQRSWHVDAASPTRSFAIAGAASSEFQAATVRGTARTSRPAPSTRTSRYSRWRSR